MSQLPKWEDDTLQDYWTFHGRILQRTDKAILFACDELDGEEIWLPISQIYYDDASELEALVGIPEWLAYKKGLI